MEKSDFTFELPSELIAQTPLESRDSSRLLCIDRASSNSFEHRHFYELPSILKSGDCLVLNDSRVLPARLIGTRSTGGAVEVLLLHSVPIDAVGAAFCRPLATTSRPYSKQSASTWECLVRPGSKIKQGAQLTFGEGELTATVSDVLGNGNRIIEFHSSGDFDTTLNKLGKMPLPPYIHENLQDPERYQTVYSRELGSAAAPTAGLHFTNDLLETLKDKGIAITYITLHVGLGTFRPVKAENIEDHEMHSEHYTISKQTAEIINKAKDNKNRIIAVGTTACRTLETVSDDNGRINPQSGDTGIFIYPGYKFKCIDGLITNFHLPESTLIMLVSAFLGRKRTLEAYEEAIKQKYRFYSFGDAMLIL